MTQIALQQVGKQFRAPGGKTLQVLDNIDLSVATGEVVGLLGPSGCGKSTLLNIIAGLDTEHSGTMTVQGRPMREQLGAGFRVAYVFQESRLLPWFTLEQNLEFVLRAGEFAHGEWDRRITRVLDAVGLTPFRRYYPGQLSGGMQQRASIARAFCIDPDILLLDEPFSALDELTARKLRQSLLRLWDEFRTTVVFVSHNAFEATFLADRLLVMGAGQVHAEIDLRDLPRPRSYDDLRLFERSKQVLQTLEHAGGSAVPSTAALHVH